MKKPVPEISKPKANKQDAVSLGFLLIILAWGFYYALAMPADVLAENSSTSYTGKKPDWINPPTYQYDPQGKQNPFLSFLRTRNQEEQGKEKRKPRAELGPLQRISVSQLRLVAILWDLVQTDGALAMVELPDGKGFVLRKGTKVGRQDGQVISINKNRLVVDEEVISVLGEKQTRTQVLELHASSGE